MESDEKKELNTHLNVLKLFVHTHEFLDDKFRRRQYLKDEGSREAGMARNFLRFWLYLIPHTISFYHSWITQVLVEYPLRRMFGLRPYYAQTVQEIREELRFFLEDPTRQKNHLKEYFYKEFVGLHSNFTTDYDELIKGFSELKADDNLEHSPFNKIPKEEQQQFTTEFEKLRAEVTNASKEDKKVKLDELSDFILKTIFPIFCKLKLEKVEGLKLPDTLSVKDAITKATISARKMIPKIEQDIFPIQSAQVNHSSMKLK